MCRTTLPSGDFLHEDGEVTEEMENSEPHIADAPGVAAERPVLVGIDGSAEAQRGLHFAADLARRLDVELVVVHAFGLMGALDTWTTPVAEREQETRQIVETKWCAPLREFAGLQWRSECIQGSAVEGILRAADSADAGFIVVGSHGAGGSATPLLGSTSHDIVQHSNRPVVVVPPADNHPHRRGGAGAMSAGVVDR